MQGSSTKSELLRLRLAGLRRSRRRRARTGDEVYIPHVGGLLEIYADVEEAIALLQSIGADLRAILVL